MKQCPYCAEEIQTEAIKCRYCHANLASAAEGALRGREYILKRESGSSIKLSLEDIRKQYKSGEIKAHDEVLDPSTKCRYWVGSFPFLGEPKPKKVERVGKTKKPYLICLISVVSIITLILCSYDLFESFPRPEPSLNPFLAGDIFLTIVSVAVLGFVFIRNRYFFFKKSKPNTIETQENLSNVMPRKADSVIADELARIQDQDALGRYCGSIIVKRSEVPVQNQECPENKGMSVASGSSANQAPPRKNTKQSLLLKFAALMLSIVFMLMLIVAVSILFPSSINIFSLLSNFSTTQAPTQAKTDEQPNGSLPRQIRDNIVNDPTCTGVKREAFLRLTDKFFLGQDLATVQNKFVVTDDSMIRKESGQISVLLDGAEYSLTFSTVNGRKVIWLALGVYDYHCDQLRGGLNAASFGKPDSIERVTGNKEWNCAQPLHYTLQDFDETTAQHLYLLGQMVAEQFGTGGGKIIRCTFSFGLHNPQELVSPSHVLRDETNKLNLPPILNLPQASDDGYRELDDKNSKLDLEVIPGKNESQTPTLLFTIETGIENEKQIVAVPFVMYLNPA